MRVIAAVPRGTANLWHHSGPGFDAFGVWTEKKPGRGEDAEPLLAHHEPSGRGVIGVFDGAGGAGRSPAGSHTQAFIASRVAREAVKTWFTTRSDTPLAHHVGTALRHLPEQRTRMRGTLQRAYPTTIAAVGYEVGRRDVAFTAHWAGDSRCYLAEPGRGLAALTRDDTETADALTALTEDPPMLNLACADRAFAVNSACGSAALPCLLLCATDGFFGYVRTPAEFEHVLLDTLTSAQDVPHWSAMLTERVRGYTGDDATLSLVALGYRGFAELRAKHTARARVLRERHARPMDQAADLRSARAASWAAYRGDYERRMP